MKAVTLMAALAFALVLAGCGSGNEVQVGEGAGFWNGLWDGLTCWIAFFLQLFGEDYNVYEVRNNGGWYNLGFLFGIGLWGGVGSAGATRR